ncbi:aromatic ring-hydroxylating dioxygenase subunit alpha [Vallitalea pronyensis]|uniref:Aromatic ring-hydroxylating dioxygenase subunit alpha n=1 Tax=Vallitalea pronyensis TaxID=1348613 RepID=A0A8J8SIF9_9FIRM|nr:aromatic ring-hydroxylating dioxygenase subunit alpha [Vallitalea pronyensis]QUI24417.1 aromatic ring-hydroxylating dioxygenase subunit alpha [Vallitalea pronyensis]
MIRNQWYVIASSDEIKEKPIGMKRFNEKLVLWRDKAGKVVCLFDKCCHRGVALSKGSIVHDHLQCPFHGLAFDAEGKCVLVPANGKEASVPKHYFVNKYTTHEAHGFIWIFWGDTDKIQSEPSFFNNLYGMHYATKKDPWKAHYSRVIENQLDCAHVPFIHKKTIGRGNKTMVDGPKVVWKKDDQFYMYVYNKLDDGSQPKKPNELKEKPEGSQRLEFIFPNLWQNYITSKMRIVGAFVPIDDEHTILYLRFYQNFINIPLIRPLVHWLFMKFNIKVAHEDRRVVETQRPIISRLNIGEKLFQADLPIIEYRKLREQLLKEADKSAEVS